MCGLAGLLDARRGASDDELTHVAVRMAACLQHRGPDSAGVWTDASAGYAVGHRRLAILDLSPAGAQPMTSQSGRFVLAFNGEIYDFRRLRAMLEADGCRFRGSSDTEVLLEAIERHGLVDTLRDVDGMFALALWDRAERTLVLARDKLGEKPLYVGRAGSALVFGSELKALRAHPDAGFDVDPGSVAVLMRLSYIPAPWSIYRQVSKLPAGCLLRVSADGSHAGPEPYWTLREVVEQGQREPFEGDEQEAVDELESLLRQSVRHRLESDVPLGAFLSGGVDSSVVAALAQHESGGLLRTFAVSLGEGAQDEGPAARAVANHLGTQHTELRVEAEQGLELVPRLPSLYDEPFADPSQLPTTLICAAAREHVTVCLSGDGGDEVFGGYNRYTAGERLWSRLHRVPTPLRAGVGGLVQRVPPERWDRAHAAGARLLPPLRGLHDPGTKAHKAGRLLVAVDGRDVYRTLVSQWQEPSTLLRGQVEHPSAATDHGWLPDRGLIGDMMFLDGISTLPDEMLTKVDRASMAVGLEVRVPLLSPDLVAFAWRLPQELKVRDGRGKHVLRKVLERHVPASLWDRPKLGFDPPLATWLRGPLRPWAEELLEPRRLHDGGLFDSGLVRTTWQEHLSGRANHDYALWAVLVLQQWRASEGLPA